MTEVFKGKIIKNGSSKAINLPKRALNTIYNNITIGETYIFTIEVPKAEAPVENGN